MAYAVLDVVIDDFFFGPGTTCKRTKSSADEAVKCAISPANPQFILFGTDLAVPAYKVLSVTNKHNRITVITVDDVHEIKCEQTKCNSIMKNAISDLTKEPTKKK